LILAMRAWYNACENNTEDTSGNSTVVAHPDMGAATTDIWNQWNIPLADFVNMAVPRAKPVGPPFAFIIRRHSSAMESSFHG